MFLTTVVVSLLCNAFFGGMRRTRVDRDGAHHPNVCFKVGRGRCVRRYVGMGISGNEGRVIQLSKTQQTATICFKRSQGSCGRNYVRSSLASEEELFHGSIWKTVGPMLATDDVVRLRVAASRWNKGDWCGPLWTRLLQHYDTDGNRVISSVRRCIPVMEGIHRDGLQLPRKVEPHDGQEE